MDKKTSLRLQAKSIRKKLNIANISNKITDNILKSNIFSDSKNIMIYYPLENEIDVLGLMNAKNKNFYLPRMNDTNLECCPFRIGDKLNSTKYKIKEPYTNCIECSQLDLIVIPALAIDKNGNRLGYGGGFYDRFLSDVRKINQSFKTLVPISHDLVFDEIPHEDFDIKIDYFVTENFCNIIQT